MDCIVVAKVSGIRNTVEEKQKPLAVTNNSRSCRGALLRVSGEHRAPVLSIFFYSTNELSSRRRNERKQSVPDAEELSNTRI